MELSLRECSTLNARLQRASACDDIDTLRDVLRLLPGSSTKDLLQNLAASKLSKTVHKLTKHSDTSVAELAAIPVREWKTLLQQKSERSSAPTASTPIPSAAPPPSCVGDSFRETVCAKLTAALDKAPEVRACLSAGIDIDTGRIATGCESALFAHFGSVTQTYKARTRSIVFNLGEPKNAELANAIVRGTVAQDALAELDIKSWVEGRLSGSAGSGGEFGASFLAANRAREGVVSLPSGLQFRVVYLGSGQYHPAASSRCECNYHGWTAGHYPGGKKFDSSYDSGVPALFRPDEVIAGWTEALQLMVEGDVWLLFIPSRLGYGERGRAPMIAGGDTLVFLLELREIFGDEKVKKVKEARVCGETVPGARGSVSATAVDGRVASATAREEVRDSKGGGQRGGNGRGMGGGTGGGTGEGEGGDERGGERGGEGGHAA